MTSISDELGHRLMELEIKASFTEDLLDQLNLIVTRQQHQIDLLSEEVSRLRQPSRDVEGLLLSPMADDTPPHY